MVKVGQPAAKNLAEIYEGVTLIKTARVTPWGAGHAASG